MQNLIKKILFNYIKEQEEQPTESSPDSPEGNDQPEVASNTEVESPSTEPKSTYTSGGGSSGGGSSSAAPKSDNSNGKAKQTWSSGVARSVGNQIGNTVWKPNITRGVANPLQSSDTWSSNIIRGKANYLD